MTISIKDNVVTSGETVSSSFSSSLVFGYEDAEEARRALVSAGLVTADDALGVHPPSDEVLNRMLQDVQPR